MLGGVWTYDHVVATIGTVAAIAAALLAAAGVRLSRRLAAETSRPVIDFSVVKKGSDSSLPISATNSGGAADPACFAVSMDDGRAFARVKGMPEHKAGLVLELSRVDAVVATGEVRMVAARDRHGTWWDQQAPHAAIEGPGRAVSDDEILEWWTRRVFGDAGREPSNPDNRAPRSCESKRPSR